MSVPADVLSPKQQESWIQENKSISPPVGDDFGTLLDSILFSYI